MYIVESAQNMYIFVAVKEYFLSVSSYTHFIVSL